MPRSPAAFRPRARLVLATIALLAATRAAAQPSTPAAPAADSAALAAATDRVFAHLDRPGSPGCALAVYRDGRVAYARGYGLANLELGVPITPRTVFDIGSTSKQFTAMSVLLLAQDGKLSLDDPVRKHVPELPAYGRPVTIRHLLHHTSGLRDYIELLLLTGAQAEDFTTAADALDIIARQRALNFEPGSEWLYSNTGYFLMSVIVERASGVPLPRFAEERIFRPLGMTSTHFHDDHTMVVAGRATGYSPRAQGGFAIDMSDWEQIGDGAVFTTVEDLLKWDENFYTARVGGRALIDAMQRPGTLNGGKPLDYAAALFIRPYRGLRTVSHGGAWAGYRAELLRFPDQHLSVACLCNLATARPSLLAQRVADVHLAGLLKGEPLAANGGRSDGAGTPATAPARLAPARLTEYAGRYFAEELQSGITVAVDSGALVLRGKNWPREPLTPRGRDEFSAGDAFTLRFSRGVDGKVAGFALDLGRIRDVKFVREGEARGTR